MSHNHENERESKCSRRLLLAGLLKRLSMYQRQQSTLNFTLPKCLTAFTKSTGKPSLQMVYSWSFRGPQQTPVFTKQLLSYADWVWAWNQPHENKYFIPTELMRVFLKPELSAQKTTINVDYWTQKLDLLPEFAIVLGKTLTSVDWAIIIILWEGNKTKQKPAPNRNNQNSVFLICFKRQKTFELELALLPRISIKPASPPLPYLSEISRSKWVLWYLMRQGNI